VLRLFRHYVPAIELCLIATDVAVVLTAIMLGQRSGLWMGQGPLGVKSVVLAAATLLVLSVSDLYRTDLHFTLKEMTARLGLALAAAALLMAAVGFAVPMLRFGRFSFLEIFGCLFVGIFLSHAAWHRVRWSLRRATRVLVVGVSRVAPSIVELEKSGSHPFAVVGFLDDAPEAPDRVPPGAELLGKTADLLTLVDELSPELILVSLPDMRGALPMSDLLECRLRGIRVEDWPTFYEKQTGKVLVTDLRPSWLVFSDGFAKTHLTQMVKRVLDILFAMAGLFLTAPVMLLVAVAIKIDSRGPVLFRQQRVGQSGKIFTVKKFRSMREDAEVASGAVWASTDDPRVTRVGRIIRMSRIDELPQLFNVLSGSMSFVGPRPERPEFVRILQRQIPYYTGRLAVKPGITGWAQVRHQYAASVEDAIEKLQYDLYYIKNLSPFLDALIVLNTVQVVLFAKGSR
jgi:sugar transferase (PEP-CTERM system associated)